MSQSYGINQYSLDEDDDPIFTEQIMSMNDSTDQILFAIDCGKAMHIPEPNGKIPIKVAFDSVFSVIMNKMIGSTSDRVGVLLFSVESNENKAGHKHIHVLQDLAIPDAGRAKLAESYGSEGNADILRDYGSVEEEYPFGNVFWTCSDIFADSKKQRGTRRVFVITNEDNPHRDNKSLRHAAIQRAKDMYDVGIQMEVFGLNKEGHIFDPTLFYSETIPDTGAQTDEPAMVSNDIDELLERVQRSEPAKRSFFQIPFRIGPDLEIGVKGYGLILEQKRSLPQPVSTVGEQITEVVSDTTYKCADTDQNLLPSEIKYSFDVGGEQSVFSKQELEKLRTVSDPNIRLIGFMEIERLNDIPNIGHPYFIYPDEEAYSGSTRTFAALLRTMLDKGKMGVCAFTPRSNSQTSIALLYPQRETFDENGVQDMPPGFHVIRMPYSEETRYLPVASTPIATEEEVNLAVKAIFGDNDKVGMKVRSKPYDPERFENPALQLQYSVLQSLALNKPVVEEIQDQTLPKADVIDERIGQGLKELSSVLMENAGEEEPAAGQKRKAAGGDGESESQSSSHRRLTTKSVEEHYQDQTLNKCLVATLKEWLEANGIKPRPRKNDLIVQVCDVLDKRQSGA